MNELQASPIPEPAATAAGAADAGAKTRRAVALVVGLACCAVLAIAASLTPADSGLGTHTALKLSQCGWIILWDLPCPSCGMTTAFAHAADGNLWNSVKTQPLGAILALATAMTLILCTYVALTGSKILVAVANLWTGKVAWTLGGLAAAAWFYKIAAYRGIL